MKNLGLFKKFTTTLSFSFLVALAATSASLANHDIAEEGAVVLDPQGKLFHQVRQHPDLIIDHRTHQSFEVYGPVGTKTWLKSLGAKVTSLEEDTSESKAWGSGSYPSPEEIEKQVKDIVAEYKDIMTLSSIGQSGQGRELWVVKLSDNPNQDELEPEVKYIANMHGNEIVGRELMVRLLKDLGQKYRSGDAATVSLVDNTEIFIMPSMNPDGAASKRRANDSWKDLNRNFPDFSTRDNQNDSAGRETETKVVMQWQDDHNFALSANFHGGTKVVNYPWDTTADKAPLTELIKTISNEYASQVPGFYDSSEFDGGIVNGNSWYEVDGGMQDWSYYYYNDLQVTIELSHSKWPSYRDIDQYYQDNQTALIQFLSRIHQGYGVKFAEYESPKSIQITQLLPNTKKVIGTFDIRHHEFYKVLPLGNFEFEITYQDGSTLKKEVNVNFAQGNYKPNYLTL